MKNKQLRLLSNIVIAYMMIAFAWWTVLLYTKNQDAFQAKAEYWKLVLIAENQVANDAEFRRTPVYLDLEKKYTRQEWMIFGEASFFVVSLVIGFYLINRGYNEEVRVAKEKRNFLLSITHELKSPIASIKLVLETFLKRNLPKPQQDQLTEAGIKETNRLHGLVNDLLLAARLEGSYEPNFEPIDLVEMLEDILANLRTKYPQVQFDLTTSGEIDPIEGDATGLNSIAINLLENAVKYSPQPADIDISVARENGHLIWEIADHGFGIPANEKEKVFTRFYRVGNEDTRKTKGTGLGLYIVDQLVKAHRGKISVQDNQPQGTIFRIKLPITKR